MFIPEIEKKIEDVETMLARNQRGVNEQFAAAQIEALWEIALQLAKLNQEK